MPVGFHRQKWKNPIVARFKYLIDQYRSLECSQSLRELYFCSVCVLVNNWCDFSRCCLRFESQLIPGPPFVFGSLLVIIALILAVFIPEPPPAAQSGKSPAKHQPVHRRQSGQFFLFLEHFSLSYLQCIFLFPLSKVPELSLFVDLFQLNYLSATSSYYRISVFGNFHCIF